MWASVIGEHPCWNLPTRGTDELVPAAQHPEERSSASGVEGASVEKTLAVRLLYGEGDKVTRETNVKQST